MKKNKKGFTLIELLGVIILLVILFGISFFAYSRYLQMSRDKTFSIAVNSMEDATLDALTDCLRGTKNNFCNKYEIPEIGDTVKVYLSDLVSNKYIEAIRNPFEGSEECSKNNSYVIVSRDGTDAANISFKYKSCLVCGTVGSGARLSMAKVMIDKGEEDNSTIMECTGVSLKQIEKLR